MDNQVRVLSAQQAAKMIEETASELEAMHNELDGYPEGTSIPKRKESLERASTIMLMDQYVIAPPEEDLLPADSNQ